MKILLIDHHELFRDGLRCVLQKLPNGVEQLFEAGGWQEGLKFVEQHPDLNLVLLEYKSHGCNGPDSVRIFRELYPCIPLLVLSGDEDSHVINEILKYGASGFVSKSSPESTLLGALKLVLAGDIYVPPYLIQHLSTSKEYRLTRRQIQILECLTEGLSNKQISERFNLAAGTVKVHVAAVYQALRVKSRVEAVEVARQIGFSVKNHAEYSNHIDKSTSAGAFACKAGH